MKKHVFRIAVGFGVAAVAAVGGFLWYRYETSPVRVTARICGAIPGLEAGTVRETAPGRVLAGHLVFQAENRIVAACESAEIRFGGDGRVESVQAQGVEISDLSCLWPLLAAVASAETPLPEFTASGILVREVRGSRLSCEFRFLLKRAADGGYEMSLTLPGRGFAVAGRYDVASRRAELDLRGQVAPDLLDLLESRIPAELELSGPFNVDARLRLRFKRGEEPDGTLAGELTFPKDTTVSGGAWAISPGTRASFRWNGRNRPWEVVLPETALLRPIEFPLGALTVSGGADSMIRFSIVNAPASGEMNGAMRIDGHYDRNDGSWIFRQSESSDRAIRWSGELPFGDFECVWRSPRISGGGTRSRGGIEFSFGFDSLHFSAPGNPRELVIQPGTLAGSWSFGSTGPESSGFELSGLIKSGKLDWPDPESAWSASNALVSFRYSRQPGEKSAILTLEPEFGGVNLYGGGVPKLKLEGVSGNFHTGFDPLGGDVFPLRVEGQLEVRRVNPVQSMFGSGEFRNFRVSGYAELASTGAVQALRADGGAEDGLFRYPECELSAAEPAFHLKFDRNALTPGDNFLGRMEAKKLAFSVFGGKFSVPEGKMTWSGELRDAGLLPEVWRTGLELPAGVVSVGDFGGKFGSLNVGAQFDHSHLARLDAVLGSFGARQGDGSAARELAADKLTFNVTDGAGDQRGRFIVAGGRFRENGIAVNNISVNLPLEWKENKVCGGGTLLAEKVVLPGGLVREISGELDFENGVFNGSGKAASPFWPDGSLLWNGRLFRNGRWHLAGDFTLNPVTLTSPLELGGLLPVLAGAAFSGGLSAKGAFELLPEKTGWSCELTPEKAALTGNGFAFSGLSGTLRLAEGEAEDRNPGGEIRFDSVSAGPVEVENGALAFRLPRPGECDVLSGGGTVWGGRARLSAPFSFHSGSGAAEAGVVVRGLEWAGLLKAFGLAPDLVGGRGDGMLLWHLDPGGKAPSLVSAELTSIGTQTLKLETLEPYLVNEKGVSRKMVEFLRDFECRTLRVRAEEETGGDILLELSVSGRPSGQGYKKLSRSVDPADFGLDGEIDFSVNYRIPGWQKAKEKK